MTTKKKKSIEILDILTSTWSTSEYSNEKVKLSGLKKTDTIEIDVSEIGLIASMLKNDDSKVKIGAVNILGMFGKNANAYVKQIAQLYVKVDEKERSQIVTTLSVIGTLDALKEFGPIIETQPSYDAMFEILFHILTFFSEYPIECLDVILSSKNHEQIWSVIKDRFRIALETPPEKVLEFDIKKDFLDNRTPIGISQEMERKRVEKNAVFSSIDECIAKIILLQKSENKAESKAAKDIIKKVRKALK
jgi:hypothetical protein